jgi:hypothetical protein
VKNKYLKHARVSEREFRSILELFCADVEALKVSRLAKVNKNTTHRLYGLLRRRVVELAHKKTARGLATRGRWDFRETLLGFFEGCLGGCEACHGDAER